MILSLLGFEKMCFTGVDERITKLFCWCYSTGEMTCGWCLRNIYTYIIKSPNAQLATHNVNVNCDKDGIREIMQKDCVLNDLEVTEYATHVKYLFVCENGVFEKIVKLV